MKKREKQNIIGLIVLAVAASLLGRIAGSWNPYLGYLGSGFGLAFAFLAFINVSRSGKN